MLKGNGEFVDVAGNVTAIVVEYFITVTSFTAQVDAFEDRKTGR